MIQDITGIELIPGNNGMDCPGNGLSYDLSGQRLECCCDECDYFRCCMPDHPAAECTFCDDPLCPGSNAFR